MDISGPAHYRSEDIASRIAMYKWEAPLRFVDDDYKRLGLAAIQKVSAAVALTPDPLIHSTRPWAVRVEREKRVHRAMRPDELKPGEIANTTDDVSTVVVREIHDHA